MCNFLCVFNNSQEDKACYIHICAQLEQEEMASDIAQMPPKIADLNARFIMICDKIHFPPSTTARCNRIDGSRMREISLKDINWPNNEIIMSGDIMRT